MKKIIISAVVVVIIASVVILTKNNVANNNVVKIGAIMTMTGRASFLGEIDKNAMEIAIKEINAKYPNKKVILIVEDSQSDAKVAASAVSKLINIDKVDAIFVETTGPSVAVSPIAKSAGVPVIYSSFTDVPLKDNPTALKTFIDYSEVCFNYAKYLKSNNIIKVASIGDSNGLASMCADSMKVVLGESNVTVVDLMPDTDVRTEMLKLKAGEYTALVGSNYEPTMIKIMKSMNEVNYKPMFLCNTGACATKNVKETLGVANLTNIITFDAKVSDVFVNKYSSSYKVMTSGELQNAAFDYNAVDDIYNAVISCKKDDNTCFVNTIKNTKVSESAVTSYVWKNNSLVPEMKYSKFVDGVLQETDLK